MSTKTTEAKPEVVTLAESQATPEAKKEVMGIERDDQNARVSFTQDGALMIITIPLARMSTATAHGFIYLLHDMIHDWYKERQELIQHKKVLMGKAVSAFNFKQGLSKIFHK